eukprot:551315_1
MILFSNWRNMNLLVFRCEKFQPRCAPLTAASSFHSELTDSFYTMKTLSLILTLSALHCNGLLRDHRKEEFQKISNHELLYIDTTNFEYKSVIEFDAFNHHYIIKLTENKHLNPMHLRLENAYPSKDNAKDHFTP